MSFLVGPVACYVSVHFFVARGMEGAIEGPRREALTSRAWVARTLSPQKQIDLSPEQMREVVNLKRMFLIKARRVLRVM
jgi:hypothetical protein